MQLHDNASSPFRTPTLRQRPTPVFLVFSLSRRTGQCGKCRHRRIPVPTTISTTPIACVKRRPVSIFSIVITDAKPRHPDHIHHADRKHHQHHRPAAAETEKPLLQSEPEYAARRRGPVCEEERKRMLAVRETCMLERRELIDAGADENCAARTARSPTSCRYRAMRRASAQSAPASQGAKSRTTPLVYPAASTNGETMCSLLRAAVSAISA